MNTKGRRSKIISDDVNNGRWTERELTALIFTLSMCGIDATPTDHAKHMPSRNKDQILNYFNNLKKLGNFERLVEEFKVFLDEKDKSASNEKNFEKDKRTKKRKIFLGSNAYSKKKYDNRIKIDDDVILPNDTNEEGIHTGFTDNAINNDIEQNDSKLIKNDNVVYFTSLSKDLIHLLFPVASHQNISVCSVDPFKRTLKVKMIYKPPSIVRGSQVLNTPNHIEQTATVEFPRGTFKGIFKVQTFEENGFMVVSFPMDPDNSAFVIKH